MVIARFFKAREKSTERTSKKPSVFNVGGDCAMAEEKGNVAARGVRAVTVGLRGKSMEEPGAFLEIDCIL